MDSPTAISAETRAPRPGRKYFELIEANSSLPYVSRIVADLMKSYQRVVEVRRRIENLHSDDNAEHLEAQYETAMETLGDLVDELHQVGVELKDFEKGLVDFPSIHEGREIYLCWQHGEPRIASWHEVDAGFTGRRDVAMLQTADRSAA